MAGEWIKMRSNLWDDPRVSRLCDITNASEAAVVGGLYWLWAAADDHTENGVMPGLSTGAIDRKTGISGLGSALVSIGWVDDTEGGITIKRFEEHNGKSAKSRCMTAKRVANFKANGEVTVPALADDDYGVSDALPREREEKRREELTTSNPNGLVVASVADVVVCKPDCPHQEIIALYHEVLPQCPQIRDWTPARAVQLRARWNEEPRRQNLDYWRKFFEYVASCDFLVGRQHSKDKRPFFADLEWIVKAANFTKIREKKYAND